MRGHQICVFSDWSVAALKLELTHLFIVQDVLIPHSKGFITCMYTFSSINGK